MPKLNEYLGSIVSGINQARAMADQESANLARTYAQDDLLRNFSVPRFRASNIELTIPIAMGETPTNVPIDYQPIDDRSFNSITYQELKNVYQVDSFKSVVSNRLKKKIAMETDTLEKRIKGGEPKETSLQQFSKQVAYNSYEYIASSVENKEVLFKSARVNSADELIEKTYASLNKRLAGEIMEPKLEKDINEANIIVEAAKLREQIPGSLIYIKMNLTEEGMEWQNMKNQDGEEVSKLVPE